MLLGPLAAALLGWMLLGCRPVGHHEDQHIL